MFFLCLHILPFAFEKQKYKSTYFLMSSELDVRSVSFDINVTPSPAPTPTLTNRSHSLLIPVRTKTTDYGKILRTIAGINTPSLPCAVVCTAIDFLFTLITLVIGTSNLSACPVEYRVPIYLVVSATINLISMLFTIVAYTVHMKGKDEKMIGFFYVTISAVMIITLQLVNFIWLFLGTIWVFSVLNQVQFTNMNAANYCQVNLYQYAEVSVILQYIIPILVCCCKNIPLLKK